MYGPGMTPSRRRSQRACRGIHNLTDQQDTSAHQTNQHHHACPGIRKMHDIQYSALALSTLQRQAGGLTVSRSALSVQPDTRHQTPGTKHPAPGTRNDASKSRARACKCHIYPAQYANAREIHRLGILRIPRAFNSHPRMSAEPYRHVSRRGIANGSGVTRLAAHRLRAQSSAC